MQSNPQTDSQAGQNRSSKLTWPPREMGQKKNKKQKRQEVILRSFPGRNLHSTDSVSEYSTIWWWNGQTARPVLSNVLVIMQGKTAVVYVSKCETKSLNVFHWKQTHDCYQTCKLVRG